MSEDDFEIKVHIDNAGSGRLEWGAATSLEVLSRAVSLAADDAIVGHGVRRLEVFLPVADRLGRRAVHKAGFRLEGIRRQAHQMDGDVFVDVAMYSRLASDVVYGPTGFSAVNNTVLPRTRTMAHVIFRNDEGKILLCGVDYKSEYEFPGGIVEVGESPQAAAVREVKEELGIDVELGPLLTIDWMPPYLAWDDALSFMFDGGVLTASQIAAMEPLEELTSLNWLTWEEAAGHVIPTVASRLAHLRPDAEHPVYLEGGQRA